MKNSTATTCQLQPLLCRERQVMHWSAAAALGRWPRRYCPHHPKSWPWKGVCFLLPWQTTSSPQFPCSDVQVPSMGASNAIFWHLGVFLCSYTSCTYSQPPKQPRNLDFISMPPQPPGVKEATEHHLFPARSSLLVARRVWRGRQNWFCHVHRSLYWPRGTLLGYPGAFPQPGWHRRAPAEHCPGGFTCNTNCWVWTLLCIQI